MKYIFLLISGFLFALEAGTIGYLYPAGAKAGSTVQVIVGGQGNGGLRNVHVSGGGVKLRSCVSVPSRLFAGCDDQRRWGRQWLEQLYNDQTPEMPLKNGDSLGVWRINSALEQLDRWDPLILSLTARAFFARPNSLQSSPAIAQMLVLTLEIDPKARPGCRELRLIGNPGNLRSTNPLRFYISRDREYQEQFYQMPPLKKQPVEFRAPCVLNGQIEPGEADRWIFKARKGELISFAVLGRILNPYIGDGVPGNFQPLLEIRDAGGKVIALADDNYHDPDPVLDFRAPAEGMYTLIIRDALFRGREDFVYRIEVRRSPYRRPALIAPKLPIPKKHAKKIGGKNVTIPVLIEDSVAVPGQERSFVFMAAKGEKIVAEVFARRLGSPLDPIVTVYDAGNKMLAQNDDFERPNIGLVPQHVDSWLCFTAPESGLYTVKVRDTANAGGKDYGYFLRLDHPRPDFAVYAVPSAIPVSMDGGCDPITLVVEAKDGFKQEIRFETDPKQNFRLEGIRSIPAGAQGGILMGSARPQRKNELEPLRLFAVSGKIRHPVLGADSAMQAFAYTHYLVAGNLNAARCKLHEYSRCFSLDPEFKFRIRLKRGGKFVLPMKYIPHPRHENPDVSMRILDPPAGVTLENERTGNGWNVIFKAAADAPESCCNLHVLRQYSFDEKSKNGRIRQKKENQNLPGIRLEIVKGTSIN